MDFLLRVENVNDSTFFTEYAFGITAGRSWSRWGAAPGSGSVSPTNSMHSAIAPQSPLSMIGMYREHRASIGNITMVSPTHSMHGILEENDVAMECSESRENADKICMFTMDTWSDPEFAEFLRLIFFENYDF